MTTHKINFNWISIRNFLSYGDSETILNYNEHRGMTIIQGFNNDTCVKNGSGKSSLVDAFLFALFNTTAKKINNNTIPNIKSNRKECVVKLNFNIGKDEYLIERSLGPSSARLFKNEVEITKSSIIETYLFINRLIGSSYSVFKNSCILSLDYHNTNIYLMPKFQKKELIDNLLGIDIFSKMFETANKNSKIVNSTLIQNRSEYNTVSENIAQLKQNQDMFFQNHKIKVEKLVQELKCMKDEINRISVSSEEVQLVKSELTQKEKALNTLRQKLKTSYSDLNQCSRKIELSENKIETLRKYFELGNILCSECLSKVDSLLLITENSNLISSLTDSIKHLQEKKELLSGDVENYESLIEKHEASIREVSTTFSEFQNKFNKSNVLKKMFNTKKLEAISLKEETINPFDLMIESNESKTEVLLDSIKLYEKDILYLDILKFITSEDGVKRLIVKDILDLLNVRMELYLKKLESEFSVLFDENFETFFSSPQGETSYGNLSSGEVSRVHLATTLAFRDLLMSRGICSSNILFVDECIDVALDTQGVNKIMEILIEISKDQNIFIITHRQEVQELDCFNHQIEIVKSNGISKLSTTKLNS